MQLEWLSSPALHYALLIVGFCLCLFLFLTTKWEAHAAELRRGKEQRRLESSVAELRVRVELLGAELKHKTEQPPVAAAPQILGGSLNLTKRSQVIQMNRRGEPSGQIAAVLGIPQNEVELLLKVHRMVVAKL